MSQITPREISNLLAKDAERVARHLLGDGKREGHELRYGDTGGAAGKSLGVHLTGEKAGVWSDFSTGERGDLLTLWAVSKGCDIGEAIRQAKEYLGLRDTPLAGFRPVAKVIAKPDGLRGLGAAAAHWLTEERRLSPEAIKAYRLVERNGAIAFPYLTPAGELAAMKFRALGEDKYWAQADGSKCLFGWQAIPATARTVVLCEGELKALAWWDYGFPALSVPFGGGDGAKQDWIELEFDNLGRFDMVLVAMDQDAPGRKAADAITKRLGVERCAIVELPLPAEPGAKCINACLKANVSRAAISEAIRSAKPRDPEELRSAADYADEIADSFAQRGPEPGLRTPWHKVGDELVFRPGELTVIAGANGHGKSQMVGFMAADVMAKQSGRVCVASLEFKVGGWIKRLIRQLAGRADPSSDHARKLAHWLGNGRLWAFDATGTADLGRMIEVFRYARRRYDVELFVVDNLTGLGIGEDDMQGQKQVALSLANFARDEECHVWLVHHIRKGSKEADQPDKFDIKGSGAIVDLASNALLVWRNKAKEEKVAEAKGQKIPVPEDVEIMPDARLTCVKQRNYPGEDGGEPRIRLWWGGGSYQYLGNKDHTPRAMVNL